MDNIIPLHANSYDTLNFVNTKCVSVYKRVGYTPLQVIQELKPYLLPEEVEKITYVGRLDPMAEGWMHVLWSGDAEEKNQLASVDKTYEIEVLLGIQTDTGDALGLATDFPVQVLQKDIQSFVGPFLRPYPAYSSPNIKKTLKGGKQTEEQVRLQKGYISTITEKKSVEVSRYELQQSIFNKLSSCRMPGDFRLEAIQEKWKSFFTDTKHETYTVLTLLVQCGSGTYMRTLAEDMGGFALSIKRVGFGKVMFLHSDGV